MSQVMAATATHSRIHRGPIGVLGIWHLGSVTAACLAAAGNDVIAVDPDPVVVAALAAGHPPVSEPGLPELIARNAARLRFTTEPRELASASGAWVTFDTPVDDEDEADVDWVLDCAPRLLAPLPEDALVIVSSQLPVGSVAALQARCAASRGDHGLRFACVPENLRLGDALESFRAPDRIVAGVRSEEDRRELAELLAPFSTDVQWMRVESAEMTKHALNGFLATSVAFINEVAAVCESVGADAAEVAHGLKSEHRIGPRAYLRPGDAFSGGTLGRDLGFLCGLAERHGLPAHVFAGVADGNAAHRHWTRRKLLELLGDGAPDEHPPLAGRKVAVWGLTYKPGTDTLRGSSAVELCRWLADAGGAVRAHDPTVSVLPSSLAGAVELCATPLEAVAGADALVVCTAWPDYLEVPAEDLLPVLDRAVVIDPAGWLRHTLAAHPEVRHAWVGRPSDESALTRTDPMSFKAGAVLDEPRSAARDEGGRATTDGAGAGIDHALAGRTALITGATRGLGLEIARAYLDAGVDGLCICGRDAAALERAAQELSERAAPGQRVLAEVADVSVPEDVQRLVEAALAGLDGLTILVCNAGIYGPKGRIDRTDWSEWAKAVEINLFGSVLPARAVTSHFVQRGYGKIVQLSGGGATRPLPGLSAYAASKAAVVRYVETLAGELREQRVDVNAVAPGALNTRMLEEVLAAGPERVGETYYRQALRQQRSGGVPLRRGAELAVFLGSAASDGITGKLLSAVWDPWSQLPQRRADLDSDVYTIRRILPGDRGLSWGGA
jgi:UDPglucose 6-dehydrogenase